MSSRPGKKPVCLHYLRGQCTKGSACWFAHDASRAGEVPLCTYYVRGSCNRGNACLYRHGDADPRAPAAAQRTAAGEAATVAVGQDPQHQPQQGPSSLQQAPPQPPPQLSRQQKKKQKKKQAQSRQQQPQHGGGPPQQQRRRQQQQRPLGVFRFLSQAEEDALVLVEEYWEADNAGEPLFEELPLPAPAGAAGAAQTAAEASAEKGQEQAGRQEDSEEEEEEGRLAAAIRAVRASVARREPPPPLPARYSEEHMLVVSDEFADMCWCEPCKRAFRDPCALLSHATHSHAGSEKIAQLKALRACPCGRSFPSVSQLSQHIRAAHSGLGAPPGGMTEEMLEGEAIADALLGRVLMGGLLGGGMGGYGYDSEDDEEEGGMMGFSADDVYELACQGVKPWDHDAWDVLDVLNGGYY